MPGIFGGLAGALGNAEEIAREQDLQNQQLARQKKLDQAAEQDRQIQQAALLAGLRQQGVVPTSDATGDTETQTPNVAAMLGGIGAAPVASQPITTTVDAGHRYQQLGTSGFSQDLTSPTLPQVQARIQLAKQQQDEQQRMAFLRAMRPDLADKSDEQLAGVASDPATFREYIKPPASGRAAAPATQTGPDGTLYQWNPTQGAWVPAPGPNGKPVRVHVPNGNGAAQAAEDVAERQRVQSHRAYVAKQAAAYQQPVRGQYGTMTPGLSQDAAMKKATQEADAIYGPVTTPGSSSPAPVTPPKSGSKTPQQAADAAWQLIQSGQATVAQALNSPSLSDAAKAILRQKAGRPQ